MSCAYHTAVKELKERGLTGQTLESFLVQHRTQAAQTIDLQNPQQKLVIAVDEASMVSNRRLRDFLALSQKYRSTRRHYRRQATISSDRISGKPFILQQNYGVKTIQLTDIERQKDATLLKAVKETYCGDLAAAFTTLENRIVEIGKESVGGENLDRQIQRLESYSRRLFGACSETAGTNLGNYLG